MKRKVLILIAICALSTSIIRAQETPFNKISFLIGEWQGTGKGFGNNESTIKSSFQWVMNKKYIEVINDSQFAPTKQKPKGEHHIDKGYISFDKHRKAIVFRQFNIEGYVNQYILIDSLSTPNEFVFETEKIENFVPGGKARWVITKNTDNSITTTFNVAFPNKGYSCFGTNKLKRIKEGEL
ncbi:hypothetical protein EMN47_04925 [Prolixibacteraceae bacterium JC049]|nr:hypothetical protein [Prolixibacteraceae bacterium JC049]